MLFFKQMLGAVLVAISLVQALPAYAQAASTLEAGLLDAMRLNKGAEKRVGNSGQAIQAYMREGLLNPRPNKRLDYTDYYVLKGPAKLLGHDLVSIEEEYMTKFLGCCVDPGVGVVVKPVGSLANVEKFAKENGCTFTLNFDLVAHLKDVGISDTVPPGTYASVSCRDKDKAK